MRSPGPSFSRSRAVSSARSVKVQLHAGQSAGLGRGRDLVERSIDEDADFFERCRQMRNDGRNLFACHAARARGENETNRVSSRVGGQPGVVQRGVAADFDPEAHRAAGTSSQTAPLSAAPGSAWRMRLSPTRNA